MLTARKKRGARLSQASAAERAFRRSSNLYHLTNNKCAVMPPDKELILLLYVSKFQKGKCRFVSWPWNKLLRRGRAFLNGAELRTALIYNYRPAEGCCKYALTLFSSGTHDAANNIFKGIHRPHVFVLGSTGSIPLRCKTPQPERGMLFRIKSPGRRPHDAGYGKISSLSHPLKHKKPREQRARGRKIPEERAAAIHPPSRIHSTHAAVDNFCFFRAAPQIDVDIPCTQRVLSPLSAPATTHFRVYVSTHNGLFHIGNSWLFWNRRRLAPVPFVFQVFAPRWAGPGIIFGWLRRRWRRAACRLLAGAADLWCDFNAAAWRRKTYFASLYFSM